MSYFIYNKFKDKQNKATLYQIIKKKKYNNSRKKKHF